MDQNLLNEPQTEEVVVVMVPFLAQGHLNQLLHLSYLISNYGLPVHYIGSSTHNNQAKFRLSGRDSESDHNIHFHDLELPFNSSSYPKPDPAPFNFPTQIHPIFDACSHLQEPVSELLRKLSKQFRRVVVIFDSLVATVVQEAKIIPNVEAYVFISVSPFTYSVTSYFDIMKDKPFVLDSELIPENLPSNDDCFTTEAWDFLIYQEQFLGYESGRLYNSSRPIEGKYINLSENLLANDRVKHFAIGPLNPVEIMKRNENDRNLCLEWLDKQEENSVIYVSFGSITSMTNDEIMALAMGLERSEQKFIWVLRKPDDNANVLTSDDAPKGELPEQFEERVKDRGMVVRDWVPQLDILAHRSIGGFMSHCGWNSCMESISFGVPIAAWPMHSDQPKNACFVCEVLGVGVLVRDWAHRGEVVKSETIEKVVRKLMVSKEGAEIRKRARKLGQVVRDSVAKGGDTTIERGAFIAHITR